MTGRRVAGGGCRVSGVGCRILFDTLAVLQTAVEFMSDLISPASIFPIVSASTKSSSAASSETNRKFLAISICVSSSFSEPWEIHRNLMYSLRLPLHILQQCSKESIRLRGEAVRLDHRSQFEESYY